MSRIGQVAAGDIINRKVRINIQLGEITLLAIVLLKNATQNNVKVTCESKIRGRHD